MTRKPTTKSPDERRLRAQIRALMKVHAADQSKTNTDYVVREFLNLIDDEVRRTRMSIAPAVSYPTPKSFRKADGYMSSLDMTKPFFWDDEIPQPMTDAEYKEHTQIKKAIAAAALNGTFTCGGKR